MKTCVTMEENRIINYAQMTKKCLSNVSFIFSASWVNLAPNYRMDAYMFTKLTQVQVNSSEIVFISYC